MGSEPWYKNGLHFECMRCGNCCSGFSGTVRVTDEEIAALSQRLGFPEAEFRKQYTRPLRGGDISLIEKPNRDCIFFDNIHGCTVYTDRPRQCRTWPFWRSVVSSPKRWEKEAENCPGINRGPIYTPDFIKQMSEHDGISDTFPELSDNLVEAPTKGLPSVSPAPAKKR
ncbi:MAG: YkgJ family cysteine cluster protein [Deltaproteobacteria bacterium]|nr:YkgJ family cysteine cluster protein [Deltaproteobacteria bacterium]